MGNELQVMRLNIAICDDEKAIREQINELIEKEKAGICPDLYYGNSKVCFRGI